MMRDLARLILRLTMGALLAGHGAQKLFGWFGGYGVQGTAGYLESLGLRPGRPWAVTAGVTEFGGGLLTALGLFHPIGPITLTAPMALATGRGHAGKPIWVNAGGAELPVTYTAMAGALSLVGPGRFSADRLLGIRVPWYVSLLATGATAAGVAYAMTRQPEPDQPAQESATRAEAEPMPETVRAWQEQTEHAVAHAESAERLTADADLGGAADRSGNLGSTVHEQADPTERDMARYRRAVRRSGDGSPGAGDPHVSHVPGSEVEAGETTAQA
jgi:putative oxidoreductase